MSKLISRTKRKYIDLVRSYRKLIKNDQINSVRSIVNNLSKFNFELKDGPYDNIIFNDKIYINHAVTQFIFDQYVKNSIRHKIVLGLVSGCNQSIALPDQCLDYLESQGVLINRLFSKILWVSEYFLQIIKAGAVVVLVIFKYSKYVFSFKYSTQKLCKELLIGVPSLNENYLNPSVPDPYFAAWIKKIFIDNNSTSVGVLGMRGGFVYEGINFHGVSRPEHQIINISLLINFVVSSFLIFVYCVTIACFGSWHRLIILKELLIRRSIQLTNKNIESQNIYTLYTGQTYRPIWSYSDKHTLRANKLFFGSISEDVLLSTSQANHDYHYGLCTWSEYLVWDKEQEAKLKNILGDSITTTISPPFLHVSKQYNEPINGITLAVYPVSPPARRYHLGISSLSQYWGGSHDMDYKFIRDIANCAAKTNINLIIKNKRDLGNAGNKKYNHVMEKLAKKYFIKIVNEEFSPASLSALCDGAISMPYTSTALFEVKKGGKSIYYDPTKILIKDLSRSRGRLMISGVEQLEVYMESLHKR